MVLMPEPGIAFTRADDGDQRNDEDARTAVAKRLGISQVWATVNQVHGNRVRIATEAGFQGEGDALITTVPGLPLAVFTADCLGVVIRGARGVGVAHAGWRGLEAGILANVVSEMTRRGLGPEHAVVGPAIGPCCFEVGPEVAEHFPEYTAQTAWNTTSVDLIAVARHQLNLPLWVLGECTMCGSGGLSHRRDQTPERMAAIGWIKDVGEAAA